MKEIQFTRAKSLEIKQGCEWPVVHIYRKTTGASPRQIVVVHDSDMQQLNHNFTYERGVLKEANIVVPTRELQATHIVHHIVDTPPPAPSPPATTQPEPEQGAPADCIGALWATANPALLAEAQAQALADNINDTSEHP